MHNSNSFPSLSIVVLYYCVYIYLKILEFGKTSNISPNLPKNLLIQQELIVVWHPKLIFTYLAIFTLKISCCLIWTGLRLKYFVGKVNMSWFQPFKFDLLFCVQFCESAIAIYNISLNLVLLLRIDACAIQYFVRLLVKVLQI